MTAATVPYLPLLSVLVCCGLVGGFAAGLLGVGGGIVTVPVLEFALRYAGIEADHRMHVAVATSLAAIIPTSITSARLHHSRGAVDWDLARRWAPAMLAAAFIGSLLAARAPLYATADHVVDTSGRSPSEVIAELVKLLH